MEDDRNKCGPAENGPAILSRRSLLELAGLAVATAALPPVAVMAKASPSRDMTGQGVSPVMDKLSAYMSEASGRELPDEVTEKTKQHILDTMAAMISGSELTPGRAALQFAAAYGGKEVMPTKRTIRTLRRNRIQGVLWCPPPLRLVSGSASAGHTSCAP
jgi:hypothetical protein